MEVGDVFRGSYPKNSWTGWGHPDWRKHTRGPDMANACRREEEFIPRDLCLKGTLLGDSALWKQPSLVKQLAELLDCFSHWRSNSPFPRASVPDIPLTHRLQPRIERQASFECRPFRGRESYSGFKGKGTYQGTTACCFLWYLYHTAGMSKLIQALFLYPHFCISASFSNPFVPLSPPLQARRKLAMITELKNQFWTIANWTIKTLLKSSKVYIRSKFRL